MDEHQERASFEKWAKAYGRIFLATKPKFGRSGVMYEHQFTQEAWVGWQARAAIPQPAPEAANPFAPLRVVVERDGGQELVVVGRYEVDGRDTVFVSAPPAPEAQQGDLATLCAEVAKYLGSGWLVIGPDGSRFQGPTPHRAANAASKHHGRMVYDPAKAAEFAALIAEAQRKSAEENERLLEAFGSLDCPACGGSGHVGDTKPESPQPAQAVPLSDEQIARLYEAANTSDDAMTLLEEHTGAVAELVRTAIAEFCRINGIGVKLAGGGEGGNG